MDKSQPQVYDSYPLWIVILANILILSVYVAGAFIMFKLNLIIGVLYVVYIIFLERSFFKEGCVYCCYYGKSCAFGKEVIAAKFFKSIAETVICIHNQKLY